ncbi:hypothetical protein [Cryobacterium sp. Y62]|uniref:hypothetical protein n=1 Tax=Cryobacterium sp. Y62 TaxID=2048284 RepID=UPI000CE51D89|nr:hypothetical protein [Cryobacterium sp. Y62]
MSTILGLDDLIQIGDALVCRQHPLATMADLCSRAPTAIRKVETVLRAADWRPVSELLAPPRLAEAGEVVLRGG